MSDTTGKNLPKSLLSKINPVDEYLKKEMEATQIAQLALTKVMTEKDFFSDMSEEQIIAFAVLTGINEELESQILENFLMCWMIGRKSKNRKSRKENIDMFKNLREQAEKKMDIMREKFGDVFQ